MASGAKVGSLMVVHFVEQQLEGWEFARPHWPLHLTLVPWFTVADEEAAIRSLERIAGQTPPMTLHVGETENIGSTAEVLANLIENDEEINVLHEELIKTLSDTDTAFETQGFIGKEFMAHITRHAADNRHSNAGEKIVMTDYHLVRLTDDVTCRVERQFDLAGTN